MHDALYCRPRRITHSRAIIYIYSSFVGPKRGVYRDNTFIEYNGQCVCCVAHFPSVTVVDRRHTFLLSCSFFIIIFGGGQMCNEQATASGTHHRQRLTTSLRHAISLSSSIFYFFVPRQRALLYIKCARILRIPLLYIYFSYICVFPQNESLTLDDPFFCQ